MQYEQRLTGPAAPDLQIALASLQEARELRYLRISAVVLGSMAICAIVWAMPWLPPGMTWHDFSAATLVEFALLIGLWIGTTAAVLRWAPLLTGEPKSEWMRALLGERLSIRGRKRFLIRLRFQCEQALRGRGKGFSIAVLTLPAIGRGTPDGEGKMDRVLHTVRHVIRTGDVLGDSEEDEVWVLLADAGGQGSQSVCTRIATRLGQLEDPTPCGAQIGWSTFETDGRDSATLLRVARQRRSALVAAPDEGLSA